MMSKLLIAVLFLVILGCKSEPESPVVETKPDPKVETNGGWKPEYDDLLKSLLSESPLLNLKSDMMVSVCPAFNDMWPKEKKVGLWVSLIYSMVGAESSYNSGTMYNETGITQGTGKQVVDVVTGKPIISEGFLQLSYADQKSFPKGRLGCDFDWIGDQGAFKEDYLLFAELGRQSVVSRQGSRSILRPEINLKCGVHIMERLQASGKSDMSVNAMLGRYWAVMKPKLFPSAVLPVFKQREPSCF